MCNMNTAITTLLLVCAKIASGAVCTDKYPEFNVMTTPYSVAVTWDKSSVNFTVRIMNDYRTDTAVCNITAQQMIRLCSRGGLEPANRFEVVVVLNDNNNNGFVTELFHSIEYTKPGRPRDLVHVSSEREIIEVRWKRPDQKERVEGYLVTLQDQTTGDIEVQDVVRTSRDQIEQRMYIKSPGTTFNLSLQTQHQTELSSVVSLLVHSAPRSVERLFEVAENRTNTSVVISWDPPTRGAVTDYRIVVTLRPNSLMPYSLLKGSPTPPDMTVPATTTTHTVASLNPASSYEVSVRALYHGNPADMDRRIEVFTSPSPVRDLIVSHVTTDTASIIWSIGDPYAANFEYRLESVTDGHTREDRGYSGNTFEVRYLKPGRLYAISLRVRMYNYPNPTSLPTTVMAQLKPEPVGYMEFDKVTSDSVFVSWKVRNYAEKYAVRVYAVNVPTLRQWSEYVYTTNTNITVMDLYPGETFYVGVTAVSGNQMSSETVNTVTILPVPPRHNVPVSLIGDTFAEVEILHESNTSVVVDFRVEYNMWGEGRVSYEIAPVEAPIARLRFLSPGRRYVVRVYARTVFGLQSPVSSEPSEFYTVPTFDSVVTVRTTTNSVAVSYTLSTRVFDQYVLTLHPTGRKERRARMERGEVYFHNLTPGTLYTVSLQVSSGGMLSQARNTSALTAPLVSLTCSNVWATVVELFLEEPCGGVDEYQLTCSACPGDGYRVIATPGGTFFNITGRRQDTISEYRAKAKIYRDAFYQESKEFSIFCKTLIE